MKKNLIGILALLLVFSSSVFAASSMTPSVLQATGGVANPEWPDRIVISIAMVSDTDGTFTSTQITAAHIPSRRLGNKPSIDYWDAGYRLVDARLVNGAASYPDTAGAVTITDEYGRQLVGATCLDTLAASTSASGIGYLLINRVSSQRDITSKLTVAMGDTQSGTATTINTLQLVFGK